MGVEWIYGPHQLIRLEGDRDDIDEALRSASEGFRASDIANLAEWNGLDVEVHP